jgi:nitrate/TMAO reductase-like tetraheme cytochrome c subunit
VTLYEFVHATAQRLGDRPRRLIKEALKFGLIACLLLVALGGVGMVYSSRPQFCNMCHYMNPYYASWQKSAHKNVACIECHFPPSVQGELQKKFEALVQVVKYATGQYGTRPWTQISDASCLREGCHETRLLQSKVDFHGVQFDHLPHLTTFRRVTRLRCTSCHSQIVQGTHMTVTESTCFLCHFAQGKIGGAPSDCGICHQFPIKTKTGFDHSFVQQRGIACQECHADVIHGAGAVPRDRCLLCHSEPERLQRYDDTAFIHENHVTNQKIECSQCHNAVQHYMPKERNYLASAQSDVCAKCHEDQHDQVGRLYAGQGADHVPGEPSPMAKADVTCEACHRAYISAAGVLGAPGAAAAHAGGGGCMLCHGEASGANLARWRAEFGEPVVQLNAALRRARGLVGAVPASQTNRLTAWLLVDRAVKNGQFVQDAYGLHNPEYARRILGTSALEANRALGLVGLSYRVPQVTWAAAAVSSSCTMCHTQPPTQTFSVYGVAFDHGLHVNQSGAQCNYCHQGGLPDQPGHGRLALQPENCRACHATRLTRANSPHPSNWVQVHGPQVATQRQTCNVCHDSNFCARCHGLSMPHPSNWVTIHPQTALQHRELCKQCHQDSFCLSCHGTPMPHPSDWVESKHGPTYRANKQLCWRCHQGSFCATCHDLPMPHPANWVSVHGKQAESLASDCVTCHKQTDCLVCHKRLAPLSHENNWDKLHPQAGKQQPDLCGLCHSTSKGTACLTCHGLPMPHPKDWDETHAKSKLSSFDKSAVCFRCHDRVKFCNQCHG